METTKTVARINNVSIIMIENGEKLIPIRPICDALGIAYQGQIDKLKSDEILGPVVTLYTAVAADNKKRKMVCIPLMYVFGWLFTINPKNVNSVARNKVIKYKKDCYNALSAYVAIPEKTLKSAKKSIDRVLKECDEFLQETE